jgi:dTDP-glucose 4,6-dehydratase
MKGGTRGQTYNVGGRCEMQNIDVVKMICDILDEIYPSAKGPRSELITFVKDRPGHDLRYAIDFNKLAAELGWAPEESFDSGIRKTIGWYVENKNWVERVKSGEYMEWIRQHYNR